MLKQKLSKLIIFDHSKNSENYQKSTELVFSNSQFKEPLVTIMMPTFNRAEFISDAIESVLHQTYQNWELIIFDNGSTDKTKQIVSKFLTDKRIRYIRNEKNLGIPKSRNVILRMSNGDFVGHLDDDDVLHADAIETMMNEFLRSKSLDMAYSDYIMIDRCKNPMANFPSTDFDKKNLHLLGFRHFCIYRKNKALKVGGFNEKIPSCEDGDFFMKIAVSGNCKRVPKYLYLYRSHEKNTGHSRPACENCDKKKICNYFKIWKRSFDSTTKLVKKGRDK